MTVKVLQSGSFPSPLLTIPGRFRALYRALGFLSVALIHNIPISGFWAHPPIVWVNPGQLVS